MREHPDPYWDEDDYDYDGPEPEDEPEPPARSREPDSARARRERYPEPEPPRERREPSPSRGSSFSGPSADGIGRTIQVLSALIALAFVLHIVFVVAGANQSSGFVSFVYSVAKFFVFGLGDVFTPGDATIGVVLNYGLAAIVYLVVGRIIGRALKR
ncbi:hypothetical protein FHX42_002362 [Saccharopolyspora lacisalsi]|uniref:YggT family protein n=1 Tax=Halosaccharopolyspora lacisalsi TaxID=1000566 RepID=A0A839E019_9PSEU|nr:hypothetical protein [Halosaccharopolyspora lacisalsi]MBA8825015.1 hypothetical protein [Halosaccharopolyspora lacisalsi]